MKKLILLMILWLGGISSAQAISFVQMADQTLLNQSTLVLEGEVIGTVPYIRQPRDYTVYRVDVTRYLKGRGFAEVQVWVPGAVEPDINVTNDSDNSVLVIPGMPRYAAGDQVLLFLNPRADGTYAISQSVLGVFRKQQTTSGNAMAKRDLIGSYELPGTGLGVLLPAADQLRDWEGFSRWLQASATGASVAPTYWNATLPGQEPRSANFTTLGTPSRWFQFDANQNVSQHAHSSGQVGLAGGGFSEFRSGITAWNNDAGSNIRYVYGGTTSASGGLGPADSVNAILFNDPNNEIEGSFSCSDGGIIATGGFRTNGTGTFNGSAFSRISESDIVIQDGAGCFLNDNNSTNAAEVFAHELGHTLGLGHSCGSPIRGVVTDLDCALNPTANDALMRAFPHADGRGADLRADDEAGAAFLYEAPSSGGGGGTTPSSSSGGGGGGGGGLDPLFLLFVTLWASIGLRTRRLALHARRER